MVTTLKNWESVVKTNHTCLHKFEQFHECGYINIFFPDIVLLTVQI